MTSTILEQALVLVETLSPEEKIRLMQELTPRKSLYGLWANHDLVAT